MVFVGNSITHGGHYHSFIWLYYMTRFPDKPITAKPAETRMGKGKGSLEYWVAVVKPGRVLFEISGVPEDVAKEALRLATHKLPCKCKVVSRADLEGGESNEN